jgi:hypothetical protein
LLSVVGSSVSSCLCSNCCLLMGRYHGHEHTRGEGGSRHPLTLEQPPALPICFMPGGCFHLVPVPHSPER